MLERVRVDACSRSAPEWYYPFKLSFDVDDGREYHLGATTEEEMLSWMQTIIEATYEFLRVVTSDLQKRLFLEECGVSAIRRREPTDSEGAAAAISMPFERRKQISQPNLRQIKAVLEEIKEPQNSEDGKGPSGGDNTWDPHSTTTIATIPED